MMRRHSFKKFLAEANSVGAKFEQKTADSVQKWLESNGLAGEWKARRYQTLDEDDGVRDEDFSDVVVENRRNDDRFFIECKEFERSNVLNIQFDISPDGRLSPVKGKKREKLTETEEESVSGLVSAIGECEGYGDFISFLNTGNELINGMKPAVFWHDSENEDITRFLPELIRKYNGIVKAGKVEADCKEFDEKNLRDSTLNCLLCALCWRLSDLNRTWDICKVEVPDIGRLVRRHYSDGKAEPAKYLQFGDDCLFATSEDNPLRLKNVPVFPSDLAGEFSIKFTPRFGTGSVYVTPRSEITSELSSQYSFINNDKWPEVIK